MRNYFPKVKSQIQYGGQDSKNSMAFKYHNKNQKAGNKTMGDILVFRLLSGIHS
jgi:xylose isomerase